MQKRLWANFDDSSYFSIARLLSPIEKRVIVYGPFETRELEMMNDDQLKEIMGSNTGGAGGGQISCT